MEQIRKTVPNKISRPTHVPAPDVLAFPLPIRYKKGRDFTFWVSDVETMSEDGFRIAMPVELFMNDRIDFEIFDGTSRISGLADVVGIGKGNTNATCRIVARNRGSRQ